MSKHLKVLLKLWNIFIPFHKYFYIQLLYILISQGLIIITTFVSGKILTNLSTKSWNEVKVLIILYLIINFLDTFLNYLAEKNRHLNLEETIKQWSQEFSLRRILSLNSSQHIEDHSAVKLTIISKGEQASKNIIDILITTIVPTLSFLIISTATLTYINYLLGVSSFFVFVVLFFWSYYFQKTHYPFVKTDRENWNEQSKYRQEAFTHLQLIKSLAQEEYFIKTFLKKRMNALNHRILTGKRGIRHKLKRSSVTEFFSIGTLALAIYLYSLGTFTIGIIYTIFSIVNRIYWNISTLSTNMRDLPQMYSDVEKYLSVIEKKPEFKENGKKNIPLNKDILFSNLCFKYPKSDHVIFEKLSFTVEQGKTTAFVGESGSGKSTIVKLLLRFYDYKKGEIKIGQNELKNIDSHYLREHIGYVEQHVDLLDDTIRENILLGVRESEKKKKQNSLEEVAKKSRIDQFYHRLGETKFDTYIGERGIKLSGGERQRIGIARAIIKNPEILIFDEATASLDTENEAKVMEAINDVSKGKTTIIIAHRLSTVRDADKIIVMDKGAVVGEGTHDELMQTNTIYQNLVAHQVN